MSDDINLCFKPSERHMHECTIQGEDGATKLEMWEKQKHCKHSDRSTFENRCRHLRFGVFCQCEAAMTETVRVSPYPEDDLPKEPNGVLEPSPIEMDPGAIICVGKDDDIAPGADRGRSQVVTEPGTLPDRDGSWRICVEGDEDTNLTLDKWVYTGPKEACELRPGAIRRVPEGMSGIPMGGLEEDIKARVELFCHETYKDACTWYNGINRHVPYPTVSHVFIKNCREYVGFSGRKLCRVLDSSNNPMLGFEVPFGSSYEGYLNDALIIWRRDFLKNAKRVWEVLCR